MSATTLRPFFLFGRFHAREDALQLIAGIDLSVPGLLHHKVQAFGDFYPMFQSHSGAGPFEAGLVVTASNLPHKIDRTIPFVFEGNADGE